MSSSLSPINPSRLRSLPKSYSWIDHRLVHGKFLKKIGPEATTMYLFLVTVGDRRGMSYYSDSAVCKHINLSNIFASRQELIDADFISYAKPIYQVLSLEEKRIVLVSKKEIKKQMEVPATKEEVEAIFTKFRRRLK